MTTIGDGLKRLGELPDGAPMQVLLTSLRVERLVAGIELRLEIHDDLPVVTSSAEKRTLLERLDFDEGAEVVATIERLALASPGSISDFEFANFAFRHASAGVFPLLGPTSSPLLFLRDIHPMGWNVANGGSESRRELSRLEGLMRREALEELIFHDPKRGLLRALEGAEDHAEACRALELWRQRLSAGIGTPLEHRYRVGPDRIRVIDGSTEHVTVDVKLCFDASGFGIEVIRFLEIKDQAQLTPLDGELAGGRLLDREVGRFANLAALRRGQAERRYRGGRLIAAREETGTAEALCPVTRAMLGRRNSAD